MNTRIMLMISSVILLIGGVFLGAYIWISRPDPLTLQDNNVKIVAKGKQIYTENCAVCHGVNLQGQPNWTVENAEGKLPAPPHDPSGHTWHHGDKILFELTKFGAKKMLGPDYKTDMPVFSEILSDEDIIAALSYIKSTWPDDMRKRHDLLNATIRQQEAQK